ncbi:hypothetical protein GPECTOR_56g362 [Gonium pectorale]|uniref:Uncharacterized protein n=1 Tax=Gonium pectorale TaxID=33097 RepID=A0A150G5V4_GONPE|nr:hypothetical protein GPECTOR_56g362 [Gonium pectorale]|eukprot:KXZ45266.1 hypothetical protein GPECTOR_56g362 [Gonium pectorale]
MLQLGRSPAGMLANRRRMPAGPRACPSSVAAARLLAEERSDCLVARAVYEDVASLPEPQWRDNQLRWSRPAGVEQVQAPPGAPPIVVLPGFGNATTDYTEPFGNREAALATRLEVRGWRPFVVPVQRKDWFRVARGLLTRGFWRGGLTTDPGYTWYLERVAETVERALRETGAEQVVLVGHSAGGWLGRAYLGDQRYQPAGGADDAAAAAAAPQAKPGTAGAAPNPRVAAVVTLGSPQRPPPPEKKRDMTGGAQGWVDRTYPGAFFAGAGVRYVTVCGRTVRGHRDFPRQREGPRIPEEYAYDSYTEVCGDGEGVAGDCVVPLGSAMLSGARQVVLDGVYHSMSRIGTFDEESGVVWYGSEDVLDCWLGPLVAELQRGPAAAAEALVAAVEDGEAAAA